MKHAYIFIFKVAKLLPLNQFVGEIPNSDRTVEVASLYDWVKTVITSPQKKLPIWR